MDIKNGKSWNNEFGNYFWRCINLKEKLHISSVLKVSNPRHDKFDFVDINMNEDQKLFIDPCLISLNKDKVCKNLNKVIESFFDEFYKAYRERDNKKKLELLSHSGEINYTKLGYGNGKNGHGNTAEGLIYDFRELENLIKKIKSISKVIDLPVLINGFNEDGLSDLITNIIHRQLNEYTIDCLRKYEIKPNSVDEFYTWDAISASWIFIKQPCFVYNNDKVLLTPKRIVRKKYLFSADHFLQRVILERKKNESETVDENGKRTYGVTKKELNHRINKDSKNWRYDYVRNKSIEDNTILDEYHKSINSFYLGKELDDRLLDDFIYNNL